MQRRVLSIHNADDAAISDISYKNIVVEDAQFTNTPLQVAKVYTDEPDVSTTKKFKKVLVTKNVKKVKIKK